jgi:hypothetical protein
MRGFYRKAKGRTGLHPVLLYVALSELAAFYAIVLLFGNYLPVVLIFDRMPSPAFLFCCFGIGGFHRKAKGRTGLYPVLLYVALSGLAAFMP